MVLFHFGTLIENVGYDCWETNEGLSAKVLVTSVSFGVNFSPVRTVTVNR